MNEPNTQKACTASNICCRHWNHFWGRVCNLSNTFIHECNQLLWNVIQQISR